jgi:hypothetical protein
LSSIVAYCQKHENYKDEWWKNRSKFKSKTRNKGTETNTKAKAKNIKYVRPEYKQNLYCDQIKKM